MASSTARRRNSREIRLATDALGDAQQLERALGQLRMAAPAERFVGGHRPAREQHDRLKHRRHLVALQEVAELARSRGEAVRQLAPAEGHRRGPALGVAAGLAHVGAPDAELEVGEVDDVAVDQRRVLDQRTVDEAAVAAVQVPKPQLLPAQVDLGVELRDRLGGQHQLEALAAADPERHRADAHAPQRSALGDGLEIPAPLVFAAHASAPAMGQY